MTVASICTFPVVTASPEATLVEAARLMRDHHVGCVVACAPTGAPIGLLTDRDIVVSALAQSPEEIGTLRVADVMSRDVACIRADAPVDRARHAMREAGVRRLPVVSDVGTLLGILTFDDLIRHITREVSQLDELLDRELTREGIERA